MTEEFRQEIRRQAWVEMWTIQMNVFRAVSLSLQTLQNIATQTAEETRNMPRGKMAPWGYPQQWCVMLPFQAIAPPSHPRRT